MADTAEQTTYEFGGFRLDVRQRSLTGADGAAIRLKPKVFDTLAMLVRHHGELLTKPQLMDSIWGGTVVEENSLNQHISTLRRILGEKPGENRYIATVPGSGYQFVAEVRAGDALDLPHRSLAVLPLKNFSDDPEQSYFVDGMTDELIARLSRTTRLRVVSRTSAWVYRRTDKPVPTIADELGVDLIVEGSVLREAHRVRITIQLIDAVQDNHLWADTFERSFDEVLALEGEIAQSIAREIAVALDDEPPPPADTAEAMNPDAYDACLKGLEHFYKLTPADLEQSLRYFQHAYRLDPASARPHAGIAHVWIGRQQMGIAPSRVATPFAKEAALRAIELDGCLPDGPFVMSVVKGFGEFDFETAEIYMRRALALNPSYAEARAVYSHELLCLGRLDEAEVEVERAIDLDPFNPFFKAFKGVVLHFHERYHESAEQFRMALELFPTLPFALQILSCAAYMLGRFEEALDAQRRLMTVFGNEPALAALAEGGAAGGYREAMRRLAEVTAEQSRTSHTGAIYVAHRFMHAGEVDRAFEWLSEAIDQRDPNAPYIRPCFPEFRSLTDDPRREALLEKLDAAREGIYHSA
jgi:TolB-like protein